MTSPRPSKRGVGENEANTNVSISMNNNNNNNNDNTIDEREIKEHPKENYTPTLPFSNSNVHSSNNSALSSIKGVLSLVFSSFEVDLRSLALFRILVSSLVMWDILLRLPNTHAHYSDLGVLPVIEAIPSIDTESYSLHFSNGTVLFCLFLFLVHFAFAFLLLIGYRTKISHFVVWLLLVSLHNRNPLVLNTGDDLLRLLLFWSLFLPLGEKYSVDFALSPKTNTSTNKHVSCGSFAFVIQFVCFFWSECALRTGVEWEEGTAFYYLLSLDQYTTRIGYLFLYIPQWISIVITKYLMWLVTLTPLFLIFPFGVSKTVVIFLVSAFYFWWGLCVLLGLYS
eukprot:TRINITY_DN2238_c0_g3_i1.p1 TRINITY_DN2238_c0_g3~~TRINITY_DN2238_c0_g3_i1.p1  ORF type:complete len:339 (+),score=42.30 TRINITY_DN2238_c0_g3_i1:137-1153(+)